MQKIVAVLVFGFSLAMPAETRRHALVVGIDGYANGTCNAPEINRERMVGTAKLTFSGKCPENVPPLRNAVADSYRFVGLLKAKYGFADAEITHLTNKQATAKALLDTFRQKLRGLSKEDTAIFYFAGHGVRVENRIQNELVMQGALVPFDYRIGAYPILDLELRELYREADSRKVRLTVILDSCYSGALARGVLARGLPERDGRWISLKPPVFDPQNVKGFGFLAAATANQPATDGDESNPTFTTIAVDLLKRAPFPLTLAEIASQARLKLRRGQDPMTEGDQANISDVIGQSANRDPQSFTVLSVNAGGVTVNGGSWAGLTVGSTLSLTEDGTSEFVVTELRPDQASLKERKTGIGAKEGDRLKLRRWAPADSAMSVFVPASLPTLKDVDSIKACVSNSKPWELTREESSQTSVQWNDGKWQRVEADGSSGGFQCPAAALVRAEDLVLRLPPSQELADQIRKALGERTLLLTSRPDAEFEIIGRFYQGRLQYSLHKRSGRDDGMLPALTDWNKDWEVVRAEPHEYEVTDCRAQSSECATALARRIQRSRIAMDIQAQSVSIPPLATKSDRSRIPFQLIVREMRKGQCTAREVQEVVAKSDYCLYLQSNLAQGARMYVQLFTIDGAGLQSDSFAELQQYPLDTVQFGPFRVFDKDSWASTPTEGNRETFVIIASTEVPRDRPPFEKWFQDPLKRTSRDTGSMNERPESPWSVATKTYRLIKEPK